MSPSKTFYDQVLAVFRVVDEQNTGTISLLKLEALMQKLDPAMPVTELAKTSGACVVRYAEFLEYIFNGLTEDGKSVTKLKDSVEPPEPGEPSSLEVPATDADVAFICHSRDGTVLRKQSILKCDHFPSSSQIASKCKGAPNFRCVEGLPVFGSAQPTIPGCFEVLEQIRLQFKEDPRNSGKEQAQILWINCREEAVLYINGRPFCVKDRGDPFGNTETTGISPEELKQKEILLKEELFAESKQYGGRILLHSEGKPTAEEIELAKQKGHPPMGGVYAFWEPLVEVLCVHELFGCLQQQYPELKFMRLPITDEQEPEEKDVEDLHDALKSANSNWSVICNCQMGRGRTTTAMVLTSLMWSYVDSRHERKSTKDLGLGEAGLTLQNPSPELVVDLACELEKRLSNGQVASSWADRCISKCSHMQNLKAVTVKKLSALSKSSKPKEVKAASHYLERYLIIVLIAAYLLEHGTGDMTFRTWMRSKHKEVGIYDIMDKAHKHDLK